MPTVSENSTSVSRLIFQLDHVWLRFLNSDVPVLRGLNLELKRGEVFVIIGPSGEGKSVLLKTMAGLYKPTEGTALFCGANLNSLSGSRRKIFSRRIGMTFQRSGLFDSLTAAENILFPLREVVGASQREAERMMEYVLAAVDLSGQGEKYPYEMSGGMQKRLCIARALALQPEAVLYDDPTAGLDPITSTAIMDLILKMQREKQMTLVISTSDFDLALGIARKTHCRIGFLYRGDFLKMATEEELKLTRNPVIQQFITGSTTGPLSI